MPYKKVAASDLPKRRRNRLSRFELTPEWKLMKADLDKGIKRDEVLQLIFTEDDKAKYRISNRRTIARFLQKYLADHNLSYELKSFRGDLGDCYIVRATRR